MSEKRTWWYLLLSKDVIWQSFKDGKPNSVVQPYTVKEEVIVCSDPKLNWPYENGHKSPLITHPLEMYEWYKDRFRNWTHSTGENTESRENSKFEIVFWAEIPEKIARKFKKKLE